MQYDELNLHQHAVFQTQTATLFKRSWRPGRGRYAQFSHVLLLDNGGGELHWGSGIHAITGPALVFLPPEHDLTFNLEAGANCRAIGFSEELLVDTIGSKAESVRLRIFTETRSVAETFPPYVLNELTTLFAWFDDELNDPARASWMTVTAYLRLILLGAMRAAPATDTEHAEQGDQNAILLRFRHLVELHFRDQWRIEAYAQELGITYERLHGICRRSLGRSPSQLVHARLCNEAQARLERSGQSVKEIADGLGFSDPSRFSHFFKEKTGVSPMLYRKSLQERAQQEVAPANPEFADWP